MVGLPATATLTMSLGLAPSSSTSAAVARVMAPRTDVVNAWSAEADSLALAMRLITSAPMAIWGFICVRAAST